MSGTVPKFNPAQSPFDKVNSLLAFTIYHERPVTRDSDKTSIKYYLKKVVDTEINNSSSDDERIVIELKRSVKFIENKVNGRYGDNRITSVHCYFNDNKGGTVPEDKPNDLLCTMNVKRNGEFEFIPNDNIVPQEHVEFLIDIMKGWQQAIQKARR